MPSPVAVSSSEAGTEALCSSGMCCRKASRWAAIWSAVLGPLSLAKWACGEKWWREIDRERVGVEIFFLFVVVERLAATNAMQFNLRSLSLSLSLSALFFHTLTLSSKHSTAWSSVNSTSHSSSGSVGCAGTKTNLAFSFASSFFRFDAMFFFVERKK